MTGWRKGQKAIPLDDPPENVPKKTRGKNQTDTRNEDIYGENSTQTVLRVTRSRKPKVIAKNSPEVDNQLTLTKQQDLDNNVAANSSQRMQPDRPGKPRNPGLADNRRSRRTTAQVKADKEAEENRKHVEEQQNRNNAEKLRLMNEGLREQERVREQKIVSGGYDLPSWEVARLTAARQEVVEDEDIGDSGVGEDEEWNGIVEDDNEEVYAPSPPQSGDESTDGEEFDFIASGDASESDAASSDLDKPVPATKAGKTGKKATTTRVAKNDRKKTRPGPITGKGKRGGLTRAYKEAVQPTEAQAGGLHDSDIEDTGPVARSKKRAVTQNTLVAIDGDSDSSNADKKALPRARAKDPVSRTKTTPATVTPASSLPPSVQLSRSATPTSSTTPSTGTDGDSTKLKSKRDRGILKDLPPWVITKWNTFLATLKHRVLASTDPMMEFKKDPVKLTPIVQEVFDLVYPGTSYKVGGKKEPVYQAAYNRASGIKSAIATAAVSRVNKEFEKDTYKGRPEAIVLFAKHALQASGPLIYKSPTPINGSSLPGTPGYQEPVGIFESSFIVEIMKTQIPSLDLSAAQYGRPIGGLAMACAALRRVFKDRVVSNGASNKPSDRFDEEGYRPIVIAYVKQISNLRANGSTWQHLMKQYGAGTFHKQPAGAAGNMVDDDLDNFDEPLFIPPSPVKA
ncbi:hypothetical protein PQX77_015009 [Marasmius sp. AFHP31]|nr:hypothetical protein PQX77_015009 [Marasmius sp. AFHP31]